MENIWKMKNISRKIKLRLFKTIVRLITLYSCETWKINRQDEKELDVFQNKCIRKILNIRWQEHVTTSEMSSANINKTSEEVRKRRWKLIGHIMRGEEKYYVLNTALTWAPKGKRKRGRPRVTWRRTVERERER